MSVNIPRTLCTGVIVAEDAGTAISSTKAAASGAQAHRGDIGIVFVAEAERGTKTCGASRV
jgi:hypothetical protein